MDGLVASGPRTQAGEELIAQTGDEVQGLGQEGVEEVRTVEWRGGRCEVGYEVHCCWAAFVVGGLGILR